MSTVFNLVGFMMDNPAVGIAGLAVLLYIGFKIVKGLVRIALFGAAVVWIIGLLKGLIL